MVSRSTIPIVKVLNLGQLEYSKAFRVQQHFAEILLKNADAQDTLLIVEHTPGE